MPYQPWDDEYTIQLQVNKLGMYSVVTKHIQNGRMGFCRHIGNDYHVPDDYQKIKVIKRSDFPDKICIRLNDI